VLYGLPRLVRLRSGARDRYAMLDHDQRGRATARAYGGGLMCKSDHHGSAEDGGGQTSTVREPKSAQCCVTSALCLSHVTSFRADRKGSVIVT
jgi:hypothetical protein